MHVIVLAKDRNAREPAFLRFLEIGASRGHHVEMRNKKMLFAGDLQQVDVLCLKNHIDDKRIWSMIDTQGVRAINLRDACLACSDRSRLYSLLRSGGVRTPHSASCAAEVERLSFPVIRKPNLLAAPRDIRVLYRPPKVIDCERYFYQELISCDGVVYKVYCIGAEVFLVTESDSMAAAIADMRGERRRAALISDSLIEAARDVGRLTGLEVYGLDFVGSPDDLYLIDVNPFPSFRAVPEAPSALWAYLESTVKLT